MSDRPLNARHPYALIAFTTIGLVILLGVAGTAIFLSGIPLSTPVPLVFVPVAVALAAWASTTRRWRALGFRRPQTSRAPLRTPATLTVILVVLVGILLLTATTTGGMATITPPQWWAIVGLVLLVAGVEETLFRSIFVSILLPRGLGRAIVTSSLAFSVAHSVNVLTGQDLATTGRQILFAFAFGLAASTIFVSTGSIWITIALHALFNYFQLTGTTQTPAAVDWITIAILLALAAWIWFRLSPAHRQQADVASHVESRDGSPRAEARS